MVRYFVPLLLVGLFVCHSPVSAESTTGQASAIEATLSGDLGSPVAASNGKIYMADGFYNRIQVISVEDDSVNSISLPGRPQTSGGSLALSKDGTKLAVALQSAKISIITLETESVSQTYNLGNLVPLSLAFGMNSAHIHFSTTASFDQIHVLSLATGTVVNSYSLGDSGNYDPNDAQLASDDSGRHLYVLTRYGSPGRLFHTDVTDPLNPIHKAEDVHGSLGSNCRGLEVGPGEKPGVYISCGAPYYVQGISESNGVLVPTTQFHTDPYPIGVAVAPNGDVIAMRDATSNEFAVFHYDAEGILLARYLLSGQFVSGSFVSEKEDGITATILDNKLIIYAVVCGTDVISDKNCILQRMGQDDDPDGGGGITLSVTASTNKKKLPSKGGSISVNANVSGGPADRVVAEVGLRGKIVRTPLTESEPGVWTGLVKIPGSKDPKARRWTFIVLAYSGEEFFPSQLMAISVGAPTTPKKKKK